MYLSNVVTVMKKQLPCNQTNLLDIFPGYFLLNTSVCRPSLQINLGYQLL